MDGDRVTIENLRNNEYRTGFDYTPRYETRTYDLATLRSLDLFLVYQGSPLIAHTIMSFGFEGDRSLAISIETRKEGAEAYSAVRASSARTSSPMSSPTSGTWSGCAQTTAVRRCTSSGLVATPGLHPARTDGLPDCGQPAT